MRDYTSCHINMKKPAIRVFEAMGGGHLSRWLTNASPRILMYHRFSSGEESRKLRSELFESQIRLLKKHFHVAAMSDIGSMLAAGHDIPNNTVVITIDDGYSDFYQYAYPILKRYSLPATLYVTTGFVDREVWLWPDRIEYILNSTKRRQFTLDIDEHNQSYDLDAPAGMRGVWVDVAQYCLKIPNSRKLDYLRYLADELQVVVPTEPIQEYAALSWDQIQEMSANRIEMGGHTVTHPRLVHVDDELLDNEIEGCKARIERMIDKTVCSFAYPNGEKPDYDEKIKQLVRQAGYTSATVSYLNHVTADRYEMGRYSVSGNMRDFEHILWGMRLISTRIGNMFSRPL